MAQSVAPGRFGPATERRVSLGVTVPFGAAARPSERAPRLELGVDTRNSSARDPFLLVPVEARFHRTRIGITLNQQPQLMLNGREALPDGPRHNLSTAATIGIGVVVVLLVGAVVLRERLEASSD